MIAALAGAATIAASPARVTLAGASSRRITVTSRGALVAVTAAAAPVRRGAHDAASGWLTLRPRRFDLRPHVPVALTVSAAPPPRAHPGSYHALVLLTAVLPHAHGVTVRVRLGVHVVVTVARTTRFRRETRVHSEHARDADHRPSQYECRACPASARAVPGRSRMRSTSRRGRGSLSSRPKG